MSTKSRVFYYGIAVTGGLISSFEFETKEQVEEWVKLKLPILEEKYGNLKFVVYDLPGLKVGDKCRVYGEGSDEFVIESIKQYSEDRWGFCLDSGWSEEVYKCYLPAQ